MHHYKCKQWNVVIVSPNCMLWIVQAGATPTFDEIANASGQIDLTEFMRFASEYKLVGTLSLCGVYLGFCISDTDALLHNLEQY